MWAAGERCPEPRALPSKRQALGKYMLNEAIHQGKEYRRGECLWGEGMVSEVWGIRCRERYTRAGVEGTCQSHQQIDHKRGHGIGLKHPHRTWEVKLKETENGTLRNIKI